MMALRPYCLSHIGSNLIIILMNFSRHESSLKFILDFICKTCPFCWASSFSTLKWNLDFRLPALYLPIVHCIRFHWTLQSMISIRVYDTLHWISSHSHSQVFIEFCRPFRYSSQQKLCEVVGQTSGTTHMNGVVFVQKRTGYILVQERYVLWDSNLSSLVQFFHWRCMNICSFHYVLSTFSRTVPGSKCTVTILDCTSSPARTQCIRWKRSFVVRSSVQDLDDYAPKSSQQILSLQYKWYYAIKLVGSYVIILDLRESR